MGQPIAVPPELTGFHHLTAITADAGRNLQFYAGTLGMRLVKKTVNQDDVGAYHLFYADGLASPGADITFFAWPLERERRGSGAVTRTHLRVPPGSLGWWHDRLNAAGVAPVAQAERNGRPVIDFEDFEGQRLALVEDAAAPAHPWERSSVPAEHQIRGIGPITVSVARLAPTQAFLTELMSMREAGTYVAGDQDVHVFATGAGGPQGELHVALDPQARPATQGMGAVHHVAFRVPDVATSDRWLARLRMANVRFSGPIDRFYFRSLYFREPGGVLFEIATDGPGFAVDEPLDALGERLSLPPFLEPQREMIEARLAPLG